MKKSLTLILFCFFSTMCFSQDKKVYNRVLKSAFHVHDTASAYASSLYAANMLEEVAKDFPDEWLAYYWAAFIHTQCGLYRDRPKNAGEVIPSRAQQNMELAMKSYKGDSAEILSDLHALQSFVYTIHTWYPEFKDEVENFREKARQHSKISLNYNPDNPLIYVLIGTSKVSSDKLEDVVAGRALLYRAQTLFKQISEHPVMTAHWNENWLRFRWLKYADQRVAALTKE
ncbi:hypothetical protein [Ekhidna sp. To15]|uniref:hypothetical protein n=1 Tax=Ekhidna sp. To15 TaxID=3395267 RepID=UPI003F51CEA2